MFKQAPEGDRTTQPLLFRARRGTDGGGSVPSAPPLLSPSSSFPGPSMTVYYAPTAQFPFPESTRSEYASPARGLSAGATAPTRPLASPSRPSASLYYAGADAFRGSGGYSNDDDGGNDDDAAGGSRLGPHGAADLLFETRRAAEEDPITFWEVFRYSRIILTVFLEGILALVSVDTIFARMSFVLSTAASRLRVRRSLTNYTLAVRVGNILAVLVDSVVVEFLKGKKGEAFLKALAASAHGDDPIERVHSINAQVMADFVAPRLAKLDKAFVNLLVFLLTLCCATLGVTVWIVDLNFRVSALYFQEPADGADDGTSVFRVILYLTVLIFAGTLITVLVALMFPPLLPLLGIRDHARHQRQGCRETPGPDAGVPRHRPAQARSVKALQGRCAHGSGTGRRRAGKGGPEGIPGIRKCGGAPDGHAVGRGSPPLHVQIRGPIHRLQEPCGQQHHLALAR
jgi:hypothetical protein